MICLSHYLEHLPMHRVLVYPISICECGYKYTRLNSLDFNLTFTLDAGANVHLLYPEDQSKHIVEFIESELGQFCQNKELIHDRVGMGLKKV